MSPTYIEYESLDIETIWKDEIATPIAIAITEKNTTLYKFVKKHENYEQIVEFLLESCKNRKTYYVHNLTFEGLVFIKTLIKKKLNFKVISHNKTIYSLTIKTKNKKIVMRCSYRLTLLNLRTLTKLCNEKEKEVFPYKILNENIQENTEIKESDFNSIEEYESFYKKWGKNIKTYEILEQYCKNDAEITKKSINKYWNILLEHGIKDDNRTLTAAKLSINHFFNSNTKVMKKISIKLDRVIRKAYYGGRTEVFGNPYEGERVLHFDWSGMYAQCMCERVPGGTIFISNKTEEISEPGFYHITYKQNMEIPVLPIKEDKLYFKNGIFSGWYWFEEIELFREMGGKILKIKECVKSEYYNTFLKNFIENNNKIRERGGIYKQIGKNNNNTFYGRLGMDPERLEEEIITNQDNINKYVKINKNLDIWTGYTKTEKNISNVSISAAITAKARIRLYRGFKEVENNGGRVLYCDTDSIIAAFTNKNYKNVINRQLGEVYFDTSKDDTEIDDAVFCLPKTYGVRFKNGKEAVKIKGFNSTPSLKEIKDNFYNNSLTTTTNTQWTKKNFQIQKELITKTIDLRKLNKRTWSYDLKTTNPLKHT